MIVGSKVPEMPRGIRNNNPGNIRISDQKWQGKLWPNTDGAFEQFDTPEHGLRAIAKILITYFNEGCKNIEDIIGKWAPSTENNTDAYIDAVSDSSGFDSDTVLMPDAPTLTKIIPAIVTHENGLQPYDISVISSAVQDALT